MSNTILLKYKKHSRTAITPTKYHKAAGYDLYAADDGYIDGNSSTAISTDISFEIPPGYYGRVASRSGTSFKYDIETGAGVIDEDYRGIVKVKLYNHSRDRFEIEAGDRIAQIIITKIAENTVLEEVEEHTEQTERGTKGFGSSGK